MKTIRVAVAGVEVVAVMDVLDESAQIATEYGISRVLNNFNDLIAIKEINAVVICSPTDLRRPCH